MFFRTLLFTSLVAFSACDNRDSGEGGTATGGAGTATGNTSLPGTTGTTTGGGTSGGTFSCADGPSELGPWMIQGKGSTIAHPIAAAGAPVTYDDYTTSTGLGAVLTEALAAPAETAVDLWIYGAIVTARGYVPEPPSSNDGTVSFWLEDGDGAIYAYRLDLLGFDPVGLQPGDAVDMHVTSVDNFFGTPEIKDVDSFTVTSSQNPVHIVDGIANAPVTWDSYGLMNVEVYGEIASDSTDCGASCFDLAYGDGQVVTFRTSSSFPPVQGDCIHWIGPVTQFDGATQLSADDFDWYRWY